MTLWETRSGSSFYLACLSSEQSVEVPSWAELLALGRHHPLRFLQSLLGDLSLKDPNSREDSSLLD